jgi:hypothetical protein
MQQARPPRHPHPHPHGAARCHPRCTRYQPHTACQSFNTRRQTVLQLSAAKTLSDAEQLHRPPLIDPSGSDVPATRRCILALAAALAVQLGLRRPAQAEEEAAEAGAPASAALVGFRNAQQGYSLQVPGSWDKKGKAGADILFEDPGRRSTSVGVTVTPVRVDSIERFGSLEAVGKRLLDAEAAKVRQSCCRANLRILQRCCRPRPHGLWAAAHQGSSFQPAACTPASPASRPARCRLSVPPHPTPPHPPPLSLRRRAPSTCSC